MPNENTYHVPILSEEIAKALEINPKGVYIDATFGGGGHAKAILSRLDKEKGKLIVVDQDRTSFEKNLFPDKRLIPIYANFTYIRNFLRFYGIKSIDGLVADLGVSSYQFDTAERGFSILRNGPLDMRMNQAQSMTAQYIVHQYTEEELKILFQEYAQLPNAITAARTIAAARKNMKIESAQTLVKILDPISVGNKMQYLAQAFQALRIEVNNEMKNLRLFLDKCASVVAPKGRIAILSFHSVEDRIVKQAFKHTKNSEGHLVWTPINEKPIMAGKEETLSNGRARSARLRAAIKNNCSAQ